MATWKVIVGDNAGTIPTIDNNTIKTVITSPPYYGLRNYGGGKGEIGLEKTPEEYIENLCLVFDAIHPKLTEDATMWVNIGDTYASNVAEGIKKFGNAESFGRKTIDYKQPGRKISGDCKPKDMIGIPWMFAFAMRARGWYLRQEIIWEKNNCLPESVMDRCTKTHEPIFLFSKSSSYFFDVEAIKESAKTGKKKIAGGWEQDGTRRKRSVWNIPVACSETLDNEHFAVYPKALVEPCVLAGSAPGDLVCDPFNGSGTTGVVALENNRNYIGFELNKDFEKIYTKRLNDAQCFNKQDITNGEVSKLFSWE